MRVSPRPGAVIAVLGAISLKQLHEKSKTEEPP